VHRPSLRPIRGVFGGSRRSVHGRGIRRSTVTTALLLAVATGISSNPSAGEFRRPASPASGQASSTRAVTLGQPDPAAGRGLRVSYYDNGDFTGRSWHGIDRNVNFDWGSGAPGPLTDGDDFSARWTGEVVPPSSGHYTFSTYADDGVRLWVDGRKLVDDWAPDQAKERSGTITLTGGLRYDLSMEFHEREGPAVAKLLWSRPGRPKAPVPSRQLHPGGDDRDLLVGSLSTRSAAYRLGSAVTVEAQLSAAAPTVVARLAVAVRPRGAKTTLLFPVKRDVRLGPSRRTLRFTRTFRSPGTYVYWTATYHDGAWVNLLPAREVTIARTSPAPSLAASTGGGSADEDEPGAIAAPAGGPWRLAFHDEFDDGALDTRRWSTRYPRSGSLCCSNSDNGEAQWYLPGNVVEQSGELHLIARRESTNGFGYTSGLIQSKPSFSFTYGYAEARMWLPRGSGFWPAFWTWPQNERWPPEIDVLELYGDNVNSAYLTYHSAGNADQSIIRRANWTAGWHTFAVDWRPGSLRWFIDGVQVKSRTSGDVASVPMYLIANLAVADGSEAPAPTGSTPLPSRLRIDWIRVWKHA
jgi:beta-glucanase (GH16 family)